MNTPLPLTPSVFVKLPWNSVLAKKEAEIVARNIMVIRARRGNQWPLTWEQYAAERAADGACCCTERGYFDQVMPLIPDAVGAIRFSQDWADAARKAMRLESTATCSGQ